MTHSIVIVTMNRPHELRRLLASLQHQSRPPDDILIIDAGADSNLAAVFPDADNRIRRIRMRPGLSAQRNRGLDEAPGDIVTFVDDDAELTPEYAETVLGCFAREKDLVAASGVNRAAVRPGLIEHTLRRLLGVQTGCGLYRMRYSGFPDVGAVVRRRVTAEVLPSTVLSLRREACRGLRFEEYWLSGAPLGLDTGRCFGEDVFFTRQLAQRGRMAVFPEAEYTHAGSPANRESLYVTQALYVFALRWISNSAASGIGRAARLWALFGQLMINTAQSIRYRNADYLRGWIRAMRVKMG
jgi:glycosyltransferase involved in cell wall biosynthesis